MYTPRKTRGLHLALARPTSSFPAPTPTTRHRKYIVLDTHTSTTFHRVYSSEIALRATPFLGWLGQVRDELVAHETAASTAKGLLRSGEILWRQTEE